MSGGDDTMIHIEITMVDDDDDDDMSKRAHLIIVILCIINYTDEVSMRESRTFHYYY